MYWDGDPRPALVESVYSHQLYLNKSYSVSLINDSDVLPILKKHCPSIASVYPYISLPAAKSDIARLVWLYEHGGVYMDAHVKLLKHGTLLDEWLTAVNDRSNRKNKYYLYVSRRKKGNIANSMLIAVPGAPILKKWIREVEARTLRHFVDQCAAQFSSTSDGIPNTTVYVKYDINDMTGVNALSSECPNYQCRDPGVQIYVFMDSL
jgi:mannosyltransferase OCH1-like enzyme